MPTRREVVTIPAGLSADPRVVQFSLALGVPLDVAVGKVVMALSHIAICHPDGDLRDVTIEFVLDIAAAAFRRIFLDNGRCPLYDEHNMARERKRSRARGMRKKYGKKRAVSRFEEAWAMYPKRSGGNPKALALKAWNARVREGVRETELVAATRHYAEHCRTENKAGTPYVLQGATFYGPGRRWQDFTAPPPDAEVDEILAEIRRAQEE